MELKSCTAVLFVKDIKVSKDFYTNVLNLQTELDIGTNIIYKNGMSIWEINKSHIIPVKLGPKKIDNTSANRFEMYFETEDLQDIYDKLKINQVRFLHDIHEEPWGQRTIRFFDPDNHLIEIGESMYQFLTRFFKMGLTFEQISEKTGVTINDVKRIIHKN